MNTHRQVGKTAANIPPVFGEVGKLEKTCQLQTHTKAVNFSKIALTSPFL